MTSVDTDLFAPINGSSSSKTGSAIYATGITKRPDATTVDIITANPRSIYLNEAELMMDRAAQLHSQMFDVRSPSKFPVGMNLPKRFLNLNDIVKRFHDGEQEFWVACPNLTPPQKFIFAGRFGYYKVMRFSQQILHTQIAQFIAEWFWIDSTDGQISAVELGTLVVHPRLRLHHAFGNSLDALSYYQS